MGFYFRKSIGLGPFRLNFSKTGISYSLGTKGARVNISNRGTFVNVGNNGIYYRRKISWVEHNPKPIEHTNDIGTLIHNQHTITSNEITKITDTDSHDFIKELNDKGNKPAYSVIFGCLPLLIILSIFIYKFLSKPEPIEIKSTEEPQYIRVPEHLTSDIHVNPSVKSNKIGTTDPFINYTIIDSTDQKWFKIAYYGDTGFIKKEIAILKTEIRNHITIDPESLKSNYDKDKKLFWILLSTISAAFIILISILNKIDKKRLLIQIKYEIDDNFKSLYDGFSENFGEIMKSSRVWQYLDIKTTSDYKYNSGANQLINRTVITNLLKDKKPTPFFETNISIPYIGLKNTELYFFPERLVIKRGNEFGAILYKNLEINESSHDFIESEQLPNDALVVDHTWRYLNIDGTPDRRFNNNRLIPICRYNTYAFNSETGLNELIATSKKDAMNNFLKQITTIGSMQKEISEN